ncbi:hypothetical protein WMY93_019799 [Mugilogobius chulae]|uniref:RNA polymerase II subunit A C-terminal domain phosphatase n=1 Tax=Mugilogobius chulae TaxID=88201 RepID=A0AAW0NS77_9GOBI
MDEPPVESGGGGGGAAAEGPVVQVAQVCLPVGAVPLRLLEWKVKPGSLINVDSVLALAVPIPTETGAEGARLPERKVKADRAGVVKELCCQVGQVLPPGGVIVKVEECSHPIVMKGLCAECGQDLTQLQSSNGKQQAPISTATVSMVHSVPELMVSSEQAEQIGREDQQRLHRNKKLVLMVDLDQTLIHTTEQHCHRMSNRGIFHFQLGRGEPMLHTRLRPHCKEFLEKIAKLYELHVFTFGSRLYAHTIAGFLDPEKKLFSHRILSRDECIDPFSKTGNLRNLFPCGDSMVCIIDDREDVWKFAPNLITVKKYTYFQGTGDINAPPGSREAQMARKGASLSRLNEGAEPSGSTDEQNNGLSSRTKDHSKEESTSSTQGKSTQEQTHPSDVRGDNAAQGKDSEMETEISRVTENEESEKRTLVTQNASVNSSAPDHKANNLDFDLSSDSDSDSISEKPTKTDSDSESKATKDKKPKQEEGKVVKEGETKSCLEGVELSDTSLGNGCSDKQEPETESQNSELSGVTTGEEILDHNMEDEEEEEADTDQDDHLIYLEEVLERIHAEYFARYDRHLKKEVPETPDIRKIVPELKSKTLEGTMVVFSGLYPTNYPMERTREFYHAKALGASIGKSLILKAQDPDRTTHLIAARAGTEKVRQAQACKHLHVVNPDWLWSCLERWERVDERLYPLKEDYSKTPWSNSPAAFGDAQGFVKQPVFQPVPVQGRAPLPAPEIRTYDPVTGKLIRRGPPATRPSSYLQASPSDPSTLRGNPQDQTEDAAGLSPEDEQPGPSRRDRQPSMSETMPLYTLCKEDLESMDREVDDILGEESDNDDSESQAKDKGKKGESDGGERSQRKEGVSSEKWELGSQALSSDKKSQPAESTSTDSQSHSPLRGHKRKHDEAKQEEEKEEDEAAKAGAGSDEESSKDSNEEEDDSGSEADEMAAALEAELNDFM